MTKDACNNLCPTCQLAFDEICGGDADVKTCGNYEHIHNVSMQSGLDCELAADVQEALTC